MAKPYSTFMFAGHDLDQTEGLARFYFKLKTKTADYRFVETLRFPTQGIIWQNIPPRLLMRTLDDLSFAFGVSYWKLYCPKKIEIALRPLNKIGAAFWDTVYTKGLGEFYYKNKIDFRGLVKFPYDARVGSLNKGVGFPRQNRSLLQLGGGKDSIVSAELLKQHKKPFRLFVLNTVASAGTARPKIQGEVADRIGFQTIMFTRTLDPQLLALNKRSDTFNGHVPVSVLYAFSGFLAATLYDYRFVVASNEASADYGNVQYRGAVINHQWSKSLEFERLFRNYTKCFLTPDISYFSLLRQFNEIEIAQIFSRHKKYFSAFSSCNENFKTKRMLAAKRRWCGRCAKCAFVFISLAAYLSKEEIVGIFGKNLLAESSLVPVFKELLGLKNFKPFECVGTPEETRFAFALASGKDEYRNNSVMKMFERAPGSKGVHTPEPIRRTSSLVTIPKEFRRIYK